MQNAEHMRSRVVWVLATTVVIQIFTSFLYRLIPTISPIYISHGIISDVNVGYLAAVLTIGCIISLLFGFSFMERLGSFRSLQLSLIIGSLGAMLCMSSNSALIFCASLLIGMSYAPSITAASTLLQRNMPEARRNLSFSLKQAGVPVGGALAALCATAAAGQFGLTASLSVIAISSIAASLALEPIRRYVDPIDPPAKGERSATHGNITRFKGALQVGLICVSSPKLRALTITGFFLALGQGAWFAFLMPYAVFHLGWSLTAAGALFAIIQSASIIGRPWLGWMVDRSNKPIRMLAIITVSSAACSMAMAFMPVASAGYLYVGLAIVAGLTVASWNGVHIAQTAECAQVDQVSAAVAGSTVFVFIGYAVGPLLFAIGIDSAGYPMGFFLIGLATLMGVSSLRVAAER